MKAERNRNASHGSINTLFSSVMPKRRNVKHVKKDEDIGSNSLAASNISHCFICDDRILNGGVQLVLGRTPYSHTGLPAKIGQLIGDDFMVVVCASDLVCARCASLISHLDKLETDAAVVKKTLKGYITSKYRLNHGDSLQKCDSSEPNGFKASQELASEGPEEKRARIIQDTKRDVGSLLITNINKNKGKVYKCENCSFTTSDCDALLPHYSACIKRAHLCPHCFTRYEKFPGLALHVQQCHSSLIKWVCQKCSFSFQSGHEFSVHMKTHIGSGGKCGVCSFSSFDRIIIENHISTHFIHVFQCPICQTGFDLKPKLDAHIVRHAGSPKCPHCGRTFQSKEVFIKHCDTFCGSTLSCTAFTGSDDIQIINVEEESNTSDATTEDVSRDNSNKPNASSIEFYSCQSCALTFLNKMLFIEHMKMHQEHQNKNSYDKTEVSDAHEEVLKSATTAVSGECHIDDDLEDLFEKLHAETCNSSVLPSSRVEVGNVISPSPLLGQSSEVVKEGNSGSVAVLSDPHQDNSFLTPLPSQEQVSVNRVDVDTMTSQEGDLCQLSVPNVMGGVTVGQPCNSNNQESSIFVDSGQQENSSCNVGLISSPADNLFQVNDAGRVVDMSLLNPTEAQQEKCNEAIVSMAMMDPTQQQQTLIYISGGEGFEGCSEQGVLLHNATIDPNSGNIQLLQYVINNSDTVNSPSDGGLQQGIEDNRDNSGELSIEQNFCKVKPEPSLAENNSEIVSATKSDQFTCSYCKFQTSFQTALKRHLKLHKDNRCQQCSICNKVFLTTHRLLSHLETHQENASPIKCPLCLEDIDNCLLLNGHLQEKHHELKHLFSCRFCEKKFSTKRSCTYHEEGHSEMFVFPCMKCNKTFASKEEVDEHTDKYHRTDPNCRFCGKEIPNTKALLSHEQRHIQLSSNHECTVCKRVFKTKTGLQHHLATHTGEFKFCCDFCGRGFMSRMMLEEHRSRHTKEERYICDVCGRKFTFQSTYWIHRKWHDTPYPYKCNFCGKQFRHTSLLAVHKRKHTGERPYKCPHCPLTFPVSGTLKRHIILHTGVYPYQCGSCKRGFTTRHKYAAHCIKVHGNGEPVNLKETAELKMVVHDPTNNSSQDDTESWELMDELGLDSVGNAPMGNSPIIEAPEEDSLSADNVSTRVVEIVMDESYQAVATVTLAEVTEDEVVIPNIWYE